MLKMLLHISIIQSSSGSIHCYLLKSQFKTLTDLLRYVNLVPWQQVVCYVYVSRTLFNWDRLSLCLLCRIAWDWVCF